MDDKQMAKEIERRAREQNQPRPRHKIGIVAKIIIALVAVLTIYGIVSAIYYKIQDSRLDRPITHIDNDKDNDLYAGGGNPEMQRYIADLGLGKVMHCNITVQEKGGEKYDVEMMLDEGLDNADIRNLKVDGTHVDIKKTGNSVFMWKTGDHDNPGEISNANEPPFYAVRQALKFPDIEKKKSKFDCEGRDWFVEFLGLPLVEWRNYNNDNK